jgi:hypothetical protein
MKRYGFPAVVFSAITACLLVLAVPAGAARSQAKLASAGICQDYEQPAPRPVGSVTLTSRQASPGYPNLWVTTQFNRRMPAGFYQLWLAQLTIVGGEVVGCSAFLVDYFLVGPSGAYSFRSHVELPSGFQMLQVIVDDSNPFDDRVGFVSPPLGLTV